MSYTKPLPTPNKEDAPFWQAAREGKFVLPNCPDCGNIWFPPYLYCPRCLSPKRVFKEASGRAEVWGFIEMAQPYVKSFAPELPYIVALVQLEEGPIMFTNLVGIKNDEVKVGLKLQVCFDPVKDDFTLIKFKRRE